MIFKYILAALLLLGLTLFFMYSEKESKTTVKHDPKAMENKTLQPALPKIEQKKKVNEKSEFPTKKELHEAKEKSEISDEEIEEKTAVKAKRKLLGGADVYFEEITEQDAESQKAAGHFGLPPR